MNSKTLRWLRKLKGAPLTYVALGLAGLLIGLTIPALTSLLPPTPIDENAPDLVEITRTFILGHGWQISLALTGAAVGLLAAHFRLNSTAKAPKSRQGRRVRRRAKSDAP